MSYQIVLHYEDGERYHFPLATTGGWNSFGNWAERLPKEEYPTIRQLADMGAISNTRRLSFELATAMRNEPAPTESSLVHTIRDLMETIGAGHEGESAIVDDGME